MTYGEIEKIVLDYPKQQSSKFVEDPNGDETASVNPALSSMDSATYSRFYTDFENYINTTKGVGADIGMYKLQKCQKWEDIAGYVYGMQ